MGTFTKSVFDQLVKLGLPSTAENEAIVMADLDWAREALRHCKKRFASNKNPVDSVARYTAGLLRNPSKFGYVLRDGRWIDPDRPSGPTTEELMQQEAVRRAQNQRERARRQADDEKHYADMKDIWQRLPEAAKEQVRGVVLQESPLFHKCGSDSQEFELQCMREAFSLKRRAWRKKQLEERT